MRSAGLEKLWEVEQCMGRLGMISHLGVPANCECPRVVTLAACAGGRARALVPNGSKVRASELWSLCVGHYLVSSTGDAG